MKQYVVNDPGRHGLQAMRQPDQASARRTRAPALLLVGHPENASWFGHLVKSRCQIGRRELLGPYGKRVVAFWGRRARLAREDLFDHVSDERLLVCLGHALWNQNDNGVAFSVRGHGASTTTAPSHLDPRAGSIA